MSGAIQGITYSAILTGAPDSLPDLTLPPPSSLTAYLRSGEPSYYSLVLPGDAALALVDDMSERPNGEVVVTRTIRYLDGSQDAAELLRYNVDAPRYDIGPNNRSVTLSGTKQTTNSTPQTRPITLVHQRTKQANGGRVWRASMGNTVNPGDTATYAGESFQVDQVALSISPREQYMEIRE